MILGAVTIVARAASAAPSLLPPTRASYLRLADEVETALRQDVLEAWFPRTVDEERGGFRADFGRDWAPAPSGGRFSVFEARMTWIAAQVVLRRPGLRGQFLPYLAHGMRYLDDVLWDKERGGFYWGVGDDGRVSPVFGDGKNLYGIAFCLYASAAAYEATKDPKALDLSQRGFRWIEAHAHDEAHGGYLEELTGDGTVLRPGAARAAGAAVGPLGYKSMNTHIHLLEALTALYRVWPDAVVRVRVEELLRLVRDTICVEPGVMNLYFTADWRAIPDHDSYGHDVETAYLMTEAAAALGHPRDPATERMARLLVDHALAFGWDEAKGGLFREGTTFGPAEDRRREWWVEVESLNTLLLMHERHGSETPVYFEAFQRQWRFIQQYQIDHEHHGLYEMLDADGVPLVAGKGRIWKAAYHDGRAFLNVSDRLRALAASPGRAGAP